MSYTIAIFAAQNEVIEAIGALERSGFTNKELKVIAADWEHSRRIEGETDVHADEMQDLTAARNAHDQHGTGDPRVIAPIAASPAFPMSGVLTGGAAYGGTSFVNAGAFLDDDSSMGSALADLGLPADSIGACRDAITRGAIIIAVDNGSSGSNGGPDLSRGGVAEAVLRSCGAMRII